MEISIELVPRDNKQLIDEIKIIASKYPNIKTVNIPDLLKFDIRSWEACDLVKSYCKKAIPHIRAIDFSLKNIRQLHNIIDSLELKEILVVTGDMPQDLRKIYPTTSLELIRKIKEISDIKIYAGIDQYRGSTKKELEYIEKKLDAGVDGFFTQPFFDIRLMDMYMEYLEGMNVYFGITPVLSERSMYYWEIKNNVVFPKNFSHTLDWNASFAREMLTYAEKANTNIYFMPVKIDIDNYLSKIFEDTANIK